MKNIFKGILTTALLLTIISCQQKSGSDVLDGTWELRHIDGIQVPGIASDYKPGNGNLLKFEGGKYENYYRGKKDEKGLFTITPIDTTINNQKANYTIQLDNRKEKMYVSLKDNKLQIYGSIAEDGTASTYEKQ